MLGPTIGDPTVGTRSRKPALRRHHQLCRIRMERLGDQRLADAGAVRVGGVDKGDAPVHHPPEQRDRLALILRRAPNPLAGDAHRTKPKMSNWQLGGGCLGCHVDLLVREIGLIAHAETRRPAWRVTLVAYDPIDADPAGLSQSFESRRDVNTIAVDVAPVLNDVAEIDPDTELDAPPLRDCSIPFDHFALNFDGATHGIENAGELDQQPVARRLHNAAAVLLDFRVGKLAAQRFAASPDLLIVGAYPGGRGPDMRVPGKGDRERALANIAAVPPPATDPVCGRSGPLIERRRTGVQR
jgi:hypothetical protein